MKQPRALGRFVAGQTLVGLHLIRFRHRGHRGMCGDGGS